jgi:hypothetical protein
MGTSKIFAVTLMAAMVLSPSASFGGATAVVPPSLLHRSSKPVVPYVIFGCAASIIFAALVANFQRNRQLTATEAATCGLLFWLTPPKPNENIDVIAAGSRIRF